jgi:hypothetical protein
MAKCVSPSAAMHTGLAPPITKRPNRGAKAPGKQAGMGCDPEVPIAAAVVSITLLPLRPQPEGAGCGSGRGSVAGSRGRCCFQSFCSILSVAWPRWLTTKGRCGLGGLLPHSHFRPQPANAATLTIAGGVTAARRRRKIALTNARHPPLSPRIDGRLINRECGEGLDVQFRGCPRNCKRRARATVPLERSGKAVTGEDPRARRPTIDTVAGRAGCLGADWLPRATVVALRAPCRHPMSPTFARSDAGERQ